MGLYYIQNGAQLFELDATTTISQTQAGKPTNNLVESGESIADHYVNDPVKFSLTGVITDVKSLGTDSVEQRTTESFIRDITELKESKQFFTFFYGLGVGAYQNCMFTSLNITQDQTNGSVAGISSYKIRAGIQQIRLTRQAQIEQVRDPNFVDSTAEREEGAGSAQDLDASSTRFQLGVQQIKEATTGEVQE